MRNILELFGKSRLLTFDRDPDTREPTVELAHEALIQHWARLRGWIDEGRYDLRMHDLLTSAVVEWEQADRAEGFLLRDAKLTQFAAWMADTSLALTSTERTFLEASLAARRARQQRARRTRLIVGTILVVATVVSAGLAILANTQRQQAQRQASVNQSLVWAANAREEYDAGRTDLALHLAMAAVDIVDPPQDAITTLDAITNSPGISTVYHFFDDGEKPGYIDLSPDDRYLVMGTTEGYVVLWDLQEDHEVWRTWMSDWPKMQESQDYVEGLSNPEVWFNPTGSVVLVNLNDLSVSIGLYALDASDGRLLHSRPYSPGWFEYLAAFSPDGRYYATVDRFTGEVADTSEYPPEDIVIWDLETGEEMQRLQITETYTPVVTFSPDGAQLAAIESGDPALIKIVELETGEVVQSFPVIGTVNVNLVRYFPDGKLLELGIDNMFARQLYDVETGKLLDTSGSYGFTIRGLDLSSTGRLSTYFSGNQVFVWDNREMREQMTLDHPDPSISSMSSTVITSDEEAILIPYGDGSILRWDISNPAVLLDISTSLSLKAIDIEPDQNLMLASSVIPFSDEPGTAILWDADTGEEIWRIELPASAYDLDINPDGRYAAFSGGWIVLNDETLGFAGIWDLQTGEHELDLDLLQTRWGKSDLDTFVGGPFGIQFSPDGSLLLTMAFATWDGSVNGGGIAVWDAVTGELLRTLEIDESGFDALVVDFMDDTSNLIVAPTTIWESHSYNYLIWNINTGEIERSWPLGDLGYVRRLGVLPDQQHVLLASDSNGLMQMRDLNTNEVLMTYTGHSSGIRAFALSEDGSRAVTGDTTGKIIVWDVNTGEPLKIWSEHTDSVQDMVLSPDGETLYSVDSNGHLIKWQVRTPTVDEMLAWIGEHRVLVDVSEQDLERFGLTTP